MGLNLSRIQFYGQYIVYNIILYFILKTNQQRRPGRNLVTFLIFANLYLWFWETLDAKAQGEISHVRKEYYGEEVS